MTKEKETTCQICGNELTDSALVYCMRCSTPHHKDCWEFAGKCSTYACGCSDYVLTLPDSLKKDLGTAVITIDQEDHLTADGVPLVIENESESEALAEPRVPVYTYRSMSRLEVDQRWKNSFRFLAIVMASASTGVYTQCTLPFGGAFALMILTSCILFLLLVSDSAWFLDFEHEELLSGVSFFGVTRLYSVCRFCDIDKIGIQRKNLAANSQSLFDPEEDWVYFATLKIWHGPVIRITEELKSLEQVSSMAKALAKLTSTRFLRSKKGKSSLELEDGAIHHTPVQPFFSPSAIFGGTGALDVFLTLVAMIASFYLWPM